MERNSINQLKNQALEEGRSLAEFEQAEKEPSHESEAPLSNQRVSSDISSFSSDRSAGGRRTAEYLEYVKLRIQDEEGAN